MRKEKTHITSKDDISLVIFESQKDETRAGIIMKTGHTMLVQSYVIPYFVLHNMIRHSDYSPISVFSLI